MKIILNDSQWFLCSRDHIPLTEAVPVEALRDCTWVEVTLPLDVLSHLIRTGQIQDPLVGQNDLLCRWVEEKDWAFRTRFDLPEELVAGVDDLILKLRDVDCYGEIILNDQRVGSIGNQFREHRIDISEAARPGNNELIIYLRSAKKVSAVLERAHGELPSGFDTARVHARRCQCLTGWDWAARLSGASIMAVPIIEVEQSHYLQDPFIYARELPSVELGAATAEYAVISAQVEIAGLRKGSGSLAVQVIDAGGQVVAEAEINVSLKAGRVVSRHILRIESPKLWWPLAMGEQTLYRAVFRLNATDRAGNTISSNLETEFGIRTAELVRQKDSDGESFTPTINGHPVFCRGVNWIPVSMLPEQQTEDDYKLLITATAAAGMNCIRVWGGGQYEPELFYTLCDQLGILVWQDFMFACAAYPIYREFTDEVELEGMFQVRRLRNHPSIFLWCGNNENEWLHQVGELRKGSEERIIGERIWSTTLKRIVEDLDSSRPYHQSSPFGKNKHDYNDEATGDRHNWECWARWQSPEVYLRDKGRFLSEFGFQSMPSPASLERFAPGSESMDDHSLVHHQKMIQGQERLIRYLAELFRLPNSFEGWIAGTQRLQAEILRRAVEHWRRRKFATSGALIWQLHDSYPAISWSLIDYYREPKLAYELSRRFFAPLLVSIGLQLGDEEVGAFPRSVWGVPAGLDADQLLSSGVPVMKSLTVMVINDTAWSFTGELVIRVLSIDGEELFASAAEMTVAANRNSEKTILDLSEMSVEYLNHCYMTAEFRLNPDGDQALTMLETKLLEKCSALWGGAPSKKAVPFLHADFRTGLNAQAIFVEPKYFPWPENLLINGTGRPDWYEPVRS